jgi:hypothetical protein
MEARVVELRLVRSKSTAVTGLACWGAPGSGASIHGRRCCIWMSMCECESESAASNPTPAFASGDRRLLTATHNSPSRRQRRKKYAIVNSSAIRPCLARWRLSACVCAVHHAAQLFSLGPSAANRRPPATHLDSLRTASFAPATKSRPHAARHLPTPTLPPLLSCCYHPY